MLTSLLKLMRMILLVVFVLLMAPQYGITAQLSKPLREVQYCSLTKSTLHQTKSSAFKASLRELESSLRRLEDMSNQRKDSMLSQPLILKVKAQTTEGLLELTCLTKPSSKDSQLPLNNLTQVPRPKRRS